MFWAEFTSASPQRPAEELSPEFTARRLAPGHPLHHAEFGNRRLLRAASSAARSARKPLLCGLLQVYGREQLITNYSLKISLNATSTVDCALLQPFFLPLIYCRQEEHQLLLHCYTWHAQINYVQF